MTTTKYTKVRNDFIERHDLTSVEKLILIYLHGRMTRDGQPWEVNREQIATALGIGVDSVKAALARLIDKGWTTNNRKPVRGVDGRVRRPKSTVIQTRKEHVIAITPKGETHLRPDQAQRAPKGETHLRPDGDAESFPRSHRRWNTTVGNPPSNERHTSEDIPATQVQREPVQLREPVTQPDDWSAEDESEYEYEGVQGSEFASESHTSAPKAKPTRDKVWRGFGA